MSFYSLFKSSFPTTGLHSILTAWCPTSYFTLIQHNPYDISPRLCSNPAMDHPTRAPTPAMDQLMAASRMRKHDVIESDMETGREEETSIPESDWKPEKVRAIAGPNQKQLDQV